MQQLLGSRARSLCLKAAGRSPSHGSALVQSASGGGARGGTPLGMGEDEIEVQQHICDVIAGCRMPWRTLVRPLPASRSTACVLGGARHRWSPGCKACAGHGRIQMPHAWSVQLGHETRCCPRWLDRGRHPDLRLRPCFTVSCPYRFRRRALASMPSDASACCWRTWQNLKPHSGARQRCRAARR